MAGACGPRSTSRGAGAMAAFTASPLRGRRPHRVHALLRMLLWQPQIPLDCGYAVAAASVLPGVPSFDQVTWSALGCRPRCPPLRHVLPRRLPDQDRISAFQTRTEFTLWRHCHQTYGSARSHIGKGGGCGAGRTPRPCCRSRDPPPKRVPTAWNSQARQPAGGISTVTEASWPTKRSLTRSAPVHEVACAQSCCTGRNQNRGGLTALARAHSGRKALPVEMQTAVCTHTHTHTHTHTERERHKHTGTHTHRHTHAPR